MSQLDPKTAFPVPVPDRDTKPFWDGCARGELLIQRCGACGKFLWQPRPVCSSCQTPEPAWTKVSGDGIVDEVAEQPHSFLELDQQHHERHHLGVRR